MYDLIIIGAGPAGMSAAIYAKRKGLNVVVLEENVPGGQMINTSSVDNYPGMIGSGTDLALTMLKQLSALEVEVVTDACHKLERKEDLFLVEGENTYQGRTVLICTGMRPRRLNVDGEDKFAYRGISWCAICDGMLYKNKNVAVIGGGNSAIEEALYLATICNHVTIIVRSSIRADEALLQRIKEKENVVILYDSQVMGFLGDSKLSSIKVKNNESESIINVDGAFIYIGAIPNTAFLEALPILDSKHYVNVDMQMATSIPGLYAAGDVITKSVRQIVTATSDGAIAALAISKYLEK